jgi:hypothetical protein
MRMLMHRFFLLILTVYPAVVSAGTLDDFYLSRLARGHGFTALATAPPSTAQRCQTGIRHGARLDWDKLEPSTQKILARVLARPVLAGERICTPVGGHFTIHYATSGPDAPDPTDGNQNQVPDWVETVAGVFEYVYDVEVNKMGYRSPPVSSLDVYLRDLTGEGVFGLTADAGRPSFPNVSAPSYIEIDRAFTHPMYTSNGQYTKEQMLRITAAHEFHHAIQFGYNYYFDFWFAEASATWIEDELYDSVNQLYLYLSSYLPLAGTLPIDAPIGGNSEYGRWIFNRYLTETQGSRTVVRSVWEELGRTPAPASGADIPMLPLIQEVLQNNLGNNFFGFAKRLLLRDWGQAHLSDLLLIPELSAASSFSVNGTVTVVAPPLPTSYTLVLHKYLPSAVNDQALVLSLPNLPPALAVSAFKRDALGWRDEYSYNPLTQSITVPAFTSDSTVYLVICNNGGDLRSPIMVAPSFPADASVVADGSGLDANRLDIPVPAQPPIDNGGAAGDSGGGGGGGCFIATAAYGSYLHPKVAELRSFRDRYLLTNAPGRLFVALYYRVSPALARVIAEHDLLRAAARGLLVPLVLALEYPVPALLLMLLSGGGVGWRLTRRRQSARFA